MEPKEGNREARGGLRQVGQKDTTPEMRWNSCSRPRLGSTPLERFRLWMKGGNDSFFLIVIVEGIIQSFTKDFLCTFKNSRNNEKIKVLLLRRKKGNGRIKEKGYSILTK